MEDRASQSAMSTQTMSRGEASIASRMQRGKISSVLYVDGKVKQTVVDLFLYLPGMPKLFNVPVMSGKINNTNGEEYTPEKGDLVAVDFFNGNFYDPVVVGYVSPAANTIQSTEAEAPRFHRKMNGTWEKIEKDGTRRVYVKKDEVLEVEGSKNVTVKTGDITISVVQGKATVNIKGKTAWKSESGIEHDGDGSGQVKGVVQGDCLCAFTGAPHPHISASVKASK